MALIEINIPGFAKQSGESPIVILGPNGSGKTKLAQRISSSNQANAISAQRRIWVDDSLPVQEETQLLHNMRNQQNQWQNNAWYPTEDINFVMSVSAEPKLRVFSRFETAAVSSFRWLPVFFRTAFI